MSEEFKEPLSEDKGGRDELDDILGGDFFEEASEKNPNKIEEAKDNEDMSSSADQVAQEAESQEPKSLTDIPTLRGDEYPSDYKDMVNRIVWQYKMLPVLDYDSIYKEIADLSIKACPTPTLQVLNDEIQKVQSAKDRVAEIFIEVVKCYNFKKRAVDILQDAWGKFTIEKNADGRKGDAAFRLSNFIIDFATTEALLKACTHVLKNLDSLHDSLSRRITIYQLTLKLQDIGRSALPDFDFDKPSDSDNNGLADIFGEDNTKQKDNGEGGKPELRTF
jgi:hypothetical protein